MVKYCEKRKESGVEKENTENKAGFLFRLLEFKNVFKTLTQDAAKNTGNDT